MSYVTSYPTAVPAVSAIALSPGGAQTADSGIITLSNMSAGPTSLGRLCLQTVVPTEGGADRVFMTRHSLWGPLGNKLAWPQPFWHNVIGHEGGSPTPHPSQRTSILSAQPNLCWALKYMIVPPGHAQNLSFVCIHPAIHPVIIDHKLCCWTSVVLKKKRYCLWVNKHTCWSCKSFKLSPEPFPVVCLVAKCEPGEKGRSGARDQGGEWLSVRR